MLDLNKLSKLTVGDIADYEAWRRDKRKRELIDTTKELYGDNIPPDALVQIEMELSKLPSLQDDPDAALDLIAIQYLLWESMVKNDKDLTLKQVGAMVDTENINKYMEALFPPELVASKKKVVRKIPKAVTRKKRKKQSR